jgi:hypothetical protein
MEQCHYLGLAVGNEGTGVGLGGEGAGLPVVVVDGDSDILDTVVVA